LIEEDESEEGGLWCDVANLICLVRGIEEILELRVKYKLHVKGRKDWKGLVELQQMRVMLLRYSDRRWIISVIGMSNVDRSVWKKGGEVRVHKSKN
ncbi:MAG: hypothetical protein ACK55I_12295, partial [bacterium]